MASKQFLRGAVIGYGFISENGHLPAYVERSKREKDVEIVAIADICEARRSLARSRFPEMRIYADYRTLLAAESKNLDFIDICTPPCDHEEIAHFALESGLNVLCEKPLTTSIESAKALLAHAKKANQVLFPCHNYKHAPVIQAIRKVIDSGKIGRITSVTLNTFRNTHAKGVLEWNTNWRRQKLVSGGGIAMDHGSHTFYLAFDWLGGYPTSITAKMMSCNKEFDTEDAFHAVLTFPFGTANAYLTWNAGVRKVLYSLQGECGAITVDDDELQIATMLKTDGLEVAQGAVRWEVEKRSVASHWMDASHVSWFNALFNDFKKAIEENDFVGKEAREAYLCVLLIQKAYESAGLSSRELGVESDLKGVF